LKYFIAEELLSDGAIASVARGHLRRCDDLRIGIDADVPFVAIEAACRCFVPVAGIGIYG